MSIYEKTKIARALLYWAKNNNGNECYYLEDRMYAVADGDMVILLTADSYDEAKRKSKARHTQSEFDTDELCRLRSDLKSGLVVGSTLRGKYQVDRYIKALDDVIGADMKGGTE